LFICEIKINIFFLKEGEKKDWLKMKSMGGWVIMIGGIKSD